MAQEIIAERDFTVSDQELFATISGDRNPLHVDAAAARRTIAGFPVVHGMHTILWSLDSLYRSMPDLPPLSGMTIRFGRLVHIGDNVQLVVTKTERVVLDVMIGGVAVTNVAITFGAPESNGGLVMDGPLLAPDEPFDLTFEQAAVSRGRIAISDSTHAAAKLFPFAAAGMGAQRIAWLVRSSFLVGMVCPGLHSIYSRLDLTATNSESGCDEALNFQAVTKDVRFHLVKLAVSGGGWTGSLEAYVRPAPATQATMFDIAARVTTNEFCDTSAMVIGGSRGLGEIIAKILAAGGAHVVITYAIGKADAHRVQAEIIGGGGRCEVLHYDVRDDSHAQLSELTFVPDQLYYLATPPIFRRRAAGFTPKRLNEFFAFYVTGFYNICQELRLRSGIAASVFYPSSVAVITRPANMTEYTMAKAAGEILCSDMQQFEKFGPIVVRRLPRLPTDQTLTMSRIDTIDPVEVMLPIVREVHHKRLRIS